jgi:hypothetical protein
MSLSIDDVYQGKTLKASDLKNRSVKLIIADVELKNFDDGAKIILSFHKTDKQFVCNKTNANRIAEWHGKHPDNWKGKEITLYPDRTEYQGKLVDCIRVQLPIRDPEVRAAVAKHDEANPPPAEPDFAKELNDEIPF